MTIYSNPQWQVDGYGLSSKAPGAPYEYHIEKAGLLNIRPDGESSVYEWPMQLAPKRWVDQGLFEPAFLAAVQAHATAEEPPFDVELFARSMDAARLRRKRVGL